ncbi:MAG: Rhodanese domain protein, partial [Burkholderiales bacterium]|nr:Rhodanese domain protein [Burkholderiales bacterium]
MHPFTTLIDASTLSAQLSRPDLVLFDCRFELGNTAWGEAEYTAAHIPGAQYLHLDRDLSGPIGPQSGRHPLPDPGVFARTLASRSVSDDCQVVAYDQGNGAHAARLWWLARWIGLRKVAVLDGGLAAWRAAGLPLDAGRPSPKPRPLTPRLTENAWLSSEAVDQVRHEPGHLLIDARGAERFAGRNETIDPVAGHVPGARNHPFPGNLGLDGKFLTPEQLRQRWGVILGSLPPSAVIAMCGSGVTAC